VCSYGCLFRNVTLTIVCPCYWSCCAQLIDSNLETVLDSLVKPYAEITDFRSQWSGITQELMNDCTVRLEQIQVAFLRLVHSDTVLVGHSLENDLKALGILHSRCVDTAQLFPHPRGFPLRSSLRNISKRYLKTVIQDGEHCSVEDARIAMQLTQLKVQKGPDFGTNADTSNLEPITALFSVHNFKSCILLNSSNPDEKRVKLAIVGNTDHIGVTSDSDAATKVRDLGGRKPSCFVVEG